MKKWLSLCLLFVTGWSYANNLSWELGKWGTVQLPATATDLLPTAGYDFIQNQYVAGVSANVVTLYKEVNGYVGGVGEFKTQAPNVQPYIAIGADIKKYLPLINQITNLSIEGFGRYVSSTGANNHLGSGLAVSYRFQ